MASLLTQQQRDEIAARRELLNAWLDGIMADAAVPGSVKLVAWALAQHFNFDSGCAFPKQDTIARRCGLARTMVVGALAVLEHELHALTSRRGRYGKEYIFLGRETGASILDGRPPLSDVAKPNISPDVAKPNTSVVRLSDVRCRGSRLRDVGKPDVPYKDEPESEPKTEPGEGGACGAIVREVGRTAGERFARNAAAKARYRLDGDQVLVEATGFVCGLLRNELTALRMAVLAAFPTARDIVIRPRTGTGS